MAEADGQEKTEQPTERRIEESRKKGQIARSREMGTFFVLISGVTGLWLISGMLYRALLDVIHRCFVLKKADLFDVTVMEKTLLENVSSLALPIIAMFAVVFVCALIGSIIVGGVNFSSEAMAPKFNKLNPANGIKRVFSSNSVIELVKSVLKILLISSFCFFLIHGRLELILNFSTMEISYAVREAVNLMFWTMLFIVCAMIPIALLDAPYQLWHHKEELRMTKQEVKEEFKNQEGNPEVKAHLRQMMFQIINRKMMQKVPEADVVVTNPTHYAVALKYDREGTTAPVLVAKGVDEVAEKIKEIAREHQVMIVPAPPLARSLYYTTEFDEEIPRGLFAAVAQVLAYVYQMQSFKKGKGQRPRDLARDLPIPEDLRH